MEMIAGNYSGGLEYFGGNTEVSTAYSEHNALEKKTLFISPNPANNMITVHLPEPMFINEIEIYSMNGKKVSSLAIDASISKTSSLNISRLKAGIYFVKATSQHFVLGGKFVVIR
jgi:hypothetical protein